MIYLTKLLNFELVILSYYWHTELKLRKRKHAKSQRKAQNSEGQRTCSVLQARAMKEASAEGTVQATGSFLLLWQNTWLVVGRAGAGGQVAPPVSRDACPLAAQLTVSVLFSQGSQFTGWSPTLKSVSSKSINLVNWESLTDMLSGYLSASRSWHSDNKDGPFQAGSVYRGPAAAGTVVVTKSEQDSVLRENLRWAPLDMSPCHPDEHSSLKTCQPATFSNLILCAQVFCLNVCLSVCHMHAVPSEARKEH